PAQYCVERFGTALEAFKHAETCRNPQTRFFLCLVPLCRSAMRGTRYQSRFSRAHINAHVQHGDVDLDALPVPQEAEALRVYSNCDLLWTMLSESHVGVGGQDGPDQDTSDNLEQDLAGELSYGDQELLGTVGKRVLAWNTSIWSQPPSSHPH
ncbi:hypothetical protein B0T21DRAFT_431071, partial [Apiosordaria backusii]